MLFTAFESCTKPHYSLVYPYKIQLFIVDLIWHRDARTTFINNNKAQGHFKIELRQHTVSKSFKRKKNWHLSTETDAKKSNFHIQWCRFSRTFMTHALKWETLDTDITNVFSTMPGMSEFIEQPVEGDTSCPSSSPWNKHIQLLQRETTCSPLPHSCRSGDVTSLPQTSLTFPIRHQTLIILRTELQTRLTAGQVSFKCFMFSLFCTSIRIHKNVLQKMTTLCLGFEVKTLNRPCAETDHWFEDWFMAFMAAF